VPLASDEPGDKAQGDDSLSKDKLETSSKVDAGDDNYQAVKDGADSKA
jgi:hypothetical protein